MKENTDEADHSAMVIIPFKINFCLVFLLSSSLESSGAGCGGGVGLTAAARAADRSLLP